MANVRVVAATRNSRLNLIRDAVDGGAGAGKIKFYTGTQPANADAGLSGNTLLGTLTCSDPCAPGASGGVLTFSAITEDASADATGTCTWARITTSADATVFDCDVTATGGGGTITINTTSITAGGPIRMTSFTLTEPAA